MLEVAQTISVIISLAERGDDQDVVTLSTLHAAKGLEWPHVLLAGVNEGLLPFRSDDEEMTAERLEEERRLMYVGITRARLNLAIGVLRRRKKGREIGAGAAQPLHRRDEAARGSGQDRPAREAERLARRGCRARGQQRAGRCRSGPIDRQGGWLIGSEAAPAQPPTIFSGVGRGAALTRPRPVRLAS